MNQEFRNIVEEQIFQISVAGKKGERKTNCRFYRLKGEKLCSWTVEEKELEYQASNKNE